VKKINPIPAKPSTTLKDLESGKMPDLTLYNRLLQNRVKSNKETLGVLKKNNLGFQTNNRLGRIVFWRLLVSWYDHLRLTEEF